MTNSFTIDNLLNKFKLWFNKDRRVVFLVTFIIGMIIHFELYAHDLVAYDGFWHYGSFMSGKWEISLGRFFIPFIDLLKGTLIVSILTTTISMLIMSFTSIFLCDLLNIKKMYLRVIISIFLVSIPSFSLTLMYAYTADSYTYAFFFSVLTVYFLNKPNKLKYIFCALCSFILSLGFYQAYLCVTVALFFIVSIMRIFEDNDLNFKKFVTTFLVKVIFLFIGMFIYYFCFNIIVKFLHINITSYSGGNSIFSIDTIKNILPCVKNTYHTFYDFYFTDNIVSNPILLGKKFINLFAFILIFINFVVLIIKNKTFKNPWKVLAIVVFVILFPVCSCVIELIAQDRSVNLLMATALYLPFILILKQVDLLKVDGVNNILNLFSVIIVCANIWTYVISNNATYTASYLLKNQMSAIRK